MQLLIAPRKCSLGDTILALSHPLLVIISPQTGYSPYYCTSPIFNSPTLRLHEVWIFANLFSSCMREIFLVLAAPFG